MPSKGITLDWKTILVIVTLAGIIFSAGVAWSSVDTQLATVMVQLEKIEETQTAHTDKLEALALSDAKLAEKLEGHMERDQP